MTEIDIRQAERVLAFDGVTWEAVCRRCASGDETGIELLRVAWEFVINRHYASRANNDGQYEATGEFLIKCDEALMGYGELLERWRDSQ